MRTHRSTAEGEAEGDTVPLTELVVVREAYTESEEDGVVVAVLDMRDR